MRNTITILAAMLLAGCTQSKHLSPVELQALRAEAEDGSITAQAKLGAMYANGRYVPRDYEESVRWLRKAADQGHATSQLNLGIMYELGEGVSKDYEAAAQWYQKAADQGDTNAQFSLGNLYDRGLGVPEDDVEAYKWWDIASQQGHAEALHNKDRLATGMTPKQIAEAYSKSADWWAKYDARTDEE